MSLSPIELEELLRLALTALRGQTAALAPAAAAAAAPLPDAGPTLSEWLVTYRSIIGERGYKVSTVKNRDASLKHIEAVWGERPLCAIKPHEIASKLNAHKQFEWPSLHEIRSLSARTYIAEGMTPTTVQTLLGHKDPEMTAVYLDDRGLTAGVWKLVEASNDASANLREAA